MRNLSARAVQRTLCLPLMAAIVACGGGGESEPAASPAPAPAVAPQITAQPSGVSVAAGQTASFSVLASGSPPLAYQWRRGGIDIPGATSATYTTPTLTVGDDGALFTVVVGNAAGSVTSAAATLRVTATAGGGSGGSAGTLTVGGAEATSSGGTFVAQPAGHPGFPVVDAGPTCTGSGMALVCASTRILTWGEFRGSAGTLTELIGVTLMSNTSTSPGLQPGEGVNGLVVTYDPDVTSAGGSGPWYSLICGPALPCASLAASGISVDPVARTVTFTNVTLGAAGGFSGSVVLNGTLAY